MSPEIFWLTTANKNPYREPVGWKVHAILADQETTLPELRGRRAACGLRAAHGWGMDLFLDEHCKKCDKALGTYPLYTMLPDRSGEPL